MLLQRVWPTTDADRFDDDAEAYRGLKSDCAFLHDTYQNMFRGLCESCPCADNHRVNLERLLHTFCKNKIYCKKCAQIPGGPSCTYSEYHREFFRLERHERLPARERIIKYLVYLQTIWIVAASDGVRELLPNTPAEQVVMACYKQRVKPCVIAKTDAVSCECIKNLTERQQRILQVYDKYLLVKNVAASTNNRTHKECCKQTNTSLIKRARTPNTSSKQNCTTRKRVRFEEPSLSPNERETYEHRIEQLERRIEVLERNQSKDSQDMINSVVARLTQHINNIRYVTQTTSQQVARMHVREELRAALKSIFGEGNCEILAWVENQMQKTQIANVT
ncbi:hypothetical protein CYMTET_40325 [Cymbomonas tetramitiformis]|uniref:Uncharacterized protein n=1 Tax=Cymbomonas tetramitiformis TaxID=36881 RepID=A0AAE0CAC5_9CHLO|nr:hypothetical protein CYMTET_40325 [Cymbomonas tetramitiformis]